MNTKHRVISFIAIILGFFMALLDTTIVNITLPKMTEYFGTTINHISWVVNAYNLAFAAMIITASRLADQFGRKKLFMCGVFLFTLSSSLSAVSNSIEMLILFRALQGLSAAFVVPVTVPLSVEIFPPEKRGPIMALWGAFAGLAAASGPSLGGFITEFLNWRYVFFINIPIGIICLLLTFKFISESYDSTANKSIDVFGILTISASMFTLTFALIKANEKGWTSSFILSLFAISFITLILFVITELKVKNPMLPLSLFKIIPFTSGAIALFLLGLGMMSGSYFLSFFLIQVKGLSQLNAGIIISSMALSSMFFSMLSAILAKKIEARWLSALGLCLLSLSCFLYSSLTKDSTTMEIILRLIVGGAGMGLSMSNLMNSMVKNVPKDKIGITSGVNNMTRTLGTVLGVAIFLTIFTSSMTLQMSNAKNSVIKIIKADTVFDTNAKKEMIVSLKTSSEKSKTLSDTLKEIDKKEALTLKAVPLMLQSKVKFSFDKQKKETKKIFPTIQNSFKIYTVKAFSFTFKCGCLFLIPGILFAFFSDKEKKSLPSYKNNVKKATYTFPR